MSLSLKEDIVKVLLERSEGMQGTLIANTEQVSVGIFADQANP